MGRRMAEGRTLETNGETIGMPVSRAVVKANRASTGIPQQRDVHEERAPSLVSLPVFGPSIQNEDE